MDFSTRGVQAGAQGVVFFGAALPNFLMHQFNATSSGVVKFLFIAPFTFKPKLFHDVKLIELSLNQTYI